MTIKTSILAAAEKSANGRGKPYFMGNGSIVAVPGTLNQIYVTNSAGQVGVVYNSTTPNSLGYVCYVKLIDKKLQVTAGWDFYNTYVAPKVGPHWWTHSFGTGGSDIVPISGDQWLPWIVQPATTTDFTINIYRTPINTSGGWVAGGVETYDMASHIPGSAGACYVLMSVDASGTIVYTDGGTEALPADLTIADYPALPTGNKPLYLVMLYNGMIAPLQYTPILSNFIDVRHMQAGGGGGSLPTLDADRVVITDGSGNITTDPNFNYNAGLLVMGAPTVPVTGPNDLNLSSASPTFATWGHDPTNAPSFLGVRSLGSPSAPALVTSNTVLARFRGRGWYDGTNISLSTEVRMVADEDWDATHQGTRIELWGTADGAITPTLMVKIYGDGRIVSANDIEITDATKGIILKDTVTGTRYRVSVTSGAVIATPA
jgi:hypothetical protein